MGRPTSRLERERGQSLVPLCWCTQRLIPCGSHQLLCLLEGHCPRHIGFGLDAVGHGPFLSGFTSKVGSRMLPTTVDAPAFADTAFRGFVARRATCRAGLLPRLAVTHQVPQSVASVAPHHLSHIGSHAILPSVDSSTWEVFAR